MLDEEKKEISENDERVDEKAEKIEEKQVDEKKETEEEPEKFEHLSSAQEREALIEDIVAKPPEKVEEEEPVKNKVTTAEEKAEEKIEKPVKKEETETEKIIVDGQEREVPLSDIYDAGKRALQKESAADSRLEEATRLLKEAKESTPLSEKKDEEQTIEDAEAYKEKIRELTEAIQYGEGDAGEKALQEIIEMGRQQTIPDTKNLVAQIKEELRWDRINEKLHASPEDGGFADLEKDPRLLTLANQAIDAELTAGKPYTWELCKKACQDVRDWADKAAPADEVKDELQEKRERKKAIDEAKSANLKNVKITKESKPETASEIVAEMRKVRGQA